MITDVLAELEQLLRKHEQHYFADMAKKAHDTYLASPDEFRKLMTSVDWWGGSGALWEMNPGYSTGDEKLGREFTGLIVRLVDALDAEGFATPRARQVAAPFRE